MSHTSLTSRRLFKTVAIAFVAGALTALGGCAAGPAPLHPVAPQTLVSHPSGSVFDAIDATPWAPDARPASLFTPSAPKRP